MLYLVDTNVLLRFADRTHALHAITRHAVRTLRAQGVSLCVTAQNLIEFWNVASRPVVNNGLGLGPAEAQQTLRLVERLFLLLPASPAVYPEWRRLVISFGVAGVQVHDAHLVAAMRAAGITHILTFNTSDFARYAAAGIVAVDPATV